MAASPVQGSGMERCAAAPTSKRETILLLIMRDRMAFEQGLLRSKRDSKSHACRENLAGGNIKIPCPTEGNRRFLSGSL